MSITATCVYCPVRALPLRFVLSQRRSLCGTVSRAGLWPAIFVLVDDPTYELIPFQVKFGTEGKEQCIGSVFKDPSHNGIHNRYLPRWQENRLLEMHTELASYRHTNNPHESRGSPNGLYDGPVPSD